MKFDKATDAMIDGKKIRRPHFKGYWCFKDNHICAFGTDEKMTDENLNADDWEIVNEEVSKLHKKTF